MRPRACTSRTIESNGGMMNGSTHPDYTDYFEVLPSNKLATALWLESDRMRSLAITDENLKNQKEAVKQERRLSFDNQPYATAIVDVWPTLMFQNWQSSHSLIGSFEDLNAATVEDVAKFFKTYYAPDNAVLVIVGDIQIPEAKKLIETYFGDIPSQPQAQAAGHDRAGRISKPQTRVYKDPLAQVPGVVIGYPGPEAPLAGLLRAQHDRRDPDARRQLAPPAGPGEGQAVGASSTRRISAGRSPARSITAIPSRTPCSCCTSRTSRPSRSWTRCRRRSPSCRISRSTPRSCERVKTQLRASAHPRDCRARSSRAQHARAIRGRRRQAGADQHRAGRDARGDAGADPGGGEEVPDAGEARGARDPARAAAPRRQKEGQ